MGYGLSPVTITDVIITDVIITHARHSHIAIIKYYKNAVIHVQKKEYEAGKQYIPADSRVNLFDEPCFWTCP